jgi:hypothetical protein
MTDRELLEAAAKAAGVPLRVVGAKPGLYALYPDTDGVDSMCRMQQWNPLTDDGDALRLAVRLNIPVFPYDEETSTGTIGVVAKNWGSKSPTPAAP